MKRILLSFLFSIVGFPLMALVNQVPGIIHIHTTYSTGRYSVEKIVKLAEERGIKVVIITDHPLAEFEYGVPLLRNIVKKKVMESSVFTKGVGRYLAEIRRVDRTHPQVLVIPGLEAAPFYYFSGLPLPGRLKVNSWSKHLLVIGLEKEEDILNLPMVGNSRLYHYSFRSILLFWPLVLLFFGLFLTKRKKTKIIKLRLVQVKVVKRYRGWGISLIVLSLIFLANNFPFKVAPFDQYHGDQGMKPYQFFIDYVTGKGGVVFIAHPEAEATRDYRLAFFRTRKYPEMLIKTKNYTGFASLYEGMKECANPGGYWDKALKEYIMGLRANPPFTIGELDYHYEGEGGKRIDDVQTVFLIDTIDKKSVISALKRGRMYALRRTREYKMVLDDFSLEGEKGRGISGDTVSFSSSVRVNISLSLIPPQPDEMITVKVIRDGEVIKTASGKGSLEISFVDVPPAGMKKGYYRIEATTHYPHTIVSNPIFVRRMKE